MTTKLTHPDLPGQVIAVPSERLVAGYKKAGWAEKGAGEDPAKPAAEGTFIVLARSALQVKEWAKEHGVAQQRAIYASSEDRLRGLSGSTPGGLSVIELEGFSDREDADAIRGAVELIFATTPAGE